MKAYSLVGVDGNAYSIMGYTAKAMRRSGLGEMVDEMYKKAMSGDYWNLIYVCAGYIEKVNEALGLEEDDDWD